MNDDLYLSHHGILGMRWGVRRFQNPDGSLTTAGRKRYLDNEVADTANDSDGATKSKFHLSDKQKKALLVGAGVAGTLLAAYGLYRLTNANDITKSLLYDKDTGLLKKLIPSKPDDDILSVNPNATSPYAIPYLNNCSKCSCAYDLRRRGFNVQAPKGTPLTQDIIDNYYKGASKQSIVPRHFMGEEIPRVDLTDADSYMRAFQRMQFEVVRHPQEFAAAQSKQARELVSTCMRYGPGARGNISMYLTTGGGHSIAFENDDRGVPRFIDNQIAHISSNYSGSKGSAYFRENLQAHLNPFVQTEVTRTDNATPNYRFLHENDIITNSYDPEKVKLASIGVMGAGYTMAAVSASSLAKQRKRQKELAETSQENEDETLDQNGSKRSK